MEVRLLSPALSAAVTTLPLAPVAPVNTATGSNEIDSQAARGFAKSVVQQLHSSGYEAYWAGGCVRDLLVDRTPKDYDVATSARPQQVQELFGEHKTIPLGVSFGIITIVGSAAAGNVEVATFRRDSPYSDGRHPDQVEFSTAEEDALRRDFTINGLFYDPIAEQVLDFVNGRRDIERRVLRAIGDADLRFAEDWLRMLRAVRFTAAFQLEADPTTVAAIRKYSKNILGISSDRISAEISRMLIDPHL